MSNIKLQKYGTGKISLIAFPGWIHPIENEEKFLDSLGKKYSVYSVCLPGYVNNSDSNLFHNFSHLVNKVHSEINKISGKKVYVGFSMGCRLIMELEKKHPSKLKKILVGCPVNNYNIPMWGKILLLNSKIIAILRKSKTFKLLIVNIALKTITNDKHAFFKGKNVSLLGAFDSLVGLVKSQTNFNHYVNSAKFIYGEKDEYLSEAQKFELNNLTVIKNVGHNCVRDHEQEIVSCIDSFIEG